MSAKRVKPFLKWAGGKSRVAKQIASFFPSAFNQYYEPFLGSGAVYFEVSPREGCLNDLNSALINTYTCVKKNPDELIEALLILQDEYYSYTNTEQQQVMYLEKRREYNILNASHKETPSTEVSALFIFLNKTGFNGMYRENSRGEYNIPFGRHARPLICDANNIRAVSNDLKRIRLMSGSYVQAIRAAQKGDLVYLDPPYYPIKPPTASFTEYQAGGFSHADQIALLDAYRELSNRGCYVVMSNSACKEIEELYQDFNLYKIQVGRAINSKPQHRGKIDEFVITNFDVNGHTPIGIRKGGSGKGFNR